MCKSIGWILLISILLLGSCKLPALAPAQSAVELPNSYQIEKDTISTATKPRKIFFQSRLLNNLIDTVLANNFDLKMSLQRLEMARASVLVQRSYLAPQVNAVGSPSLRRFGLYTMDGAGNIVTDIEKGKVVPKNLPDFYLGLQASWEIDLWGKLKNRRDAALNRVLASTEGYNAIYTGLVAETAMAYYSLLAEDELLKVIEENIAIQEQALNVVRQQKQAGQSNELAVQQFEAQLFTWRAMRVEVAREINRLENHLYALAGKTSFSIIRDTNEFASTSLPVLSAGLPSSLLLNRPDIRQAELELLATRADLKSARASYLPNLVLNSGMGLQAYRTGLMLMFPEAIAYNLAGSLAGPLFNRRIIKAEFARATAAQKEALLNYEKQITNSFLEVSFELKNIQQLAEIYELKNKEQKILSQSIQVASSLFRTGRANYLELLFSRQNALRSSVELIGTRKEQYLSAVKLYRILGGGR